MSSKQDGLLSRWQKRKLQVEREEKREAAAQAEEIAAQQTSPIDPALVESRDVPPDEETRKAWIEELEAIDIETLSYESDFAIFMKSWVPGALRQRALRKLWTTNPALAVLDGLNDYDLDYTDAAMQAGKVASSFVPGKGYAWMEEAAQKIGSLQQDEEGGEEDLPVPEEAVAADETATEPDPEAKKDSAGSDDSPVDDPDRQA